jgi:hypothetical protein
LNEREGKDEAEEKEEMEGILQKVWVLRHCPLQNDRE